MEYQIRTATGADFDGIGQVFSGANRFHADLLPDRFQIADPIMTRDWYGRVLADPARTLIVAEADGQIAGLAMASIFESPENPILRPRRYAYVAELGVLDPYQHQGIGRLLMAGVAAWALARGVKDIELNVWERNRDALAFYETLGYQSIRRTMHLALAPDSDEG